MPELTRKLLQAQQAAWIAMLVTAWLRFRQDATVIIQEILLHNDDHHETREAKKVIISSGKRPGKNGVSLPALIVRQAANSPVCWQLKRTCHFGSTWR